MKDGKIVNIKVNQAINQEVADSVESLKPKVSKELELLLHSFTSLAPEYVSTMLVPFKAKEIVSEVMTGLPVEEFARIELEVQRLMLGQLTSPLELKDFLDKSEKLGGMGFDRRTAVKISEKIQTVIREIKELQGTPTQPVPFDIKIRSLRQDLVEAHSLQLHDERHVEALELAIRQRVNSKVDAQGFIGLLTKKIDIGGVGLNPRTAKKIGQQLELLLLGSYQG
jgi:hypothetical protein